MAIVRSAASSASSWVGIIPTYGPARYLHDPRDATQMSVRRERWVRARSTASSSTRRRAPSRRSPPGCSGTRALSAGGEVARQDGADPRPRAGRTGDLEPPTDRLDSVRQAGSEPSRAPAGHPRAEPEIAFLIGKPIEPSTPPAGVLAAIDVVIPAIEVMDSRYNQPFRLPDSVADNAGAGRVVLGAQGRRPDELVDLQVLGCLFRYRGGFETAAGGAVMGHPAAAVAWLANALAAHGERLEAGSIVLSGGLAAASAELRPDAVVSAEFDGLGTVLVQQPVLPDADSADSRPAAAARRPTKRSWLDVVGLPERRAEEARAAPVRAGPAGVLQLPDDDQGEDPQPGEPGDGLLSHSYGAQDPITGSANAGSTTCPYAVSSVKNSAPKPTKTTSA